MSTNGHLLTSLGVIGFELADSAAPESCQAFLRCLRSGQYNGGHFFRTVRPDNDRGEPPIEVVQAAALATSPDPTVRHENTARTGLRHMEGTLSLPRASPGTASGAGFFICLRESPELDFGGARNPDGQGFAAFGRVTAGMDIVRRIHSAPCTDGGPDPYIDGQLLEEPVLIMEGALLRSPRSGCDRERPQTAHAKDLSVSIESTERELVDRP